MRYAIPVFFVLTSVGTVFGQHLIVTAEGHKGSAPSTVNKDQISVQVNNHPARVDQWLPLRGDAAALQLFIAIDDGEDTDIANQFGALRNFINSQPATTQIGVAYLRNGAAMILTSPAADHQAAARALRLPLGQPGIAASPYMGVSDLVKRWPATAARREILLITSGVDPWSPIDPQNPYLLKAIEDCQRAGVIAHSIYYASAGHSGHSFWRSSWGQNYLSELGDETGGEAYWYGQGSPVAFDPYLKDLTQRLNNQYLLTVVTDDGKKGLQPIKITTKAANTSLVAASRIDIPK